MSRPELRKKVAEALGLIKAGNKIAGILNFDREESKKLMQMGYDYVAVHGDGAVLCAGARDYATAFEGRDNW
jgi:2-keto-3-deoxy-L-rhamnonate aldolase RhmA